MRSSFFFHLRISILNPSKLMAFLLSSGCKKGKRKEIRGRINEVEYGEEEI